FAVSRKWAADIGGNHAHRLPGAQQSFRKNGFAAAGNRRGDLAVANHPERLSKRVIRGRTRGSNRVSGTVNAKLKRDAAGPRVSHGSRYGERRDLGVVFAVQPDIPFFLGELAAHAAARDDRGTIAEIAFKPDAALGHRLARRYNREQGEALQYDQILFREVIERFEIPCLRAVTEFIRRRTRIAHRQDAALTGYKPLPTFRDRISKRAHQPQAGNRDTVHAAPGGAVWLFDLINFRTPSTVSRTERRFCTPSSGISMLNSFSSSNTMLMPSSESIFNASKVLSSETDSGGMRCVWAITRITFSASASVSTCSGMFRTHHNLPGLERVTHVPRASN